MYAVLCSQEQLVEYIHCQITALKILQDFQDKYNLTKDNLTDFIDVFTNVTKIMKGHVGDRDHKTWSFEGAFYFCTTAITTIGETGDLRYLDNVTSDKCRVL